MASPSKFFVAASSDWLLYAAVTKDVEVAMFELKERPVETEQGRLVLFERLVLVEEFPTIKKAQARLSQFERMSSRKKYKLVEETNPGWQDLSANWFPVAALSYPASESTDEPGRAAGGIGARLEPKIPPKVASEEVDPASVMPFEDQLASGLYKRLLVGPPIGS